MQTKITAFAVRMGSFLSMCCRPNVFWKAQNHCMRRDQRGKMHEAVLLLKLCTYCAWLKSILACVVPVWDNRMCLLQLCLGFIWTIVEQSLDKGNFFLFFFFFLERFFCRDPNFLLWITWVTCLTCQKPSSFLVLFLHNTFTFVCFLLSVLIKASCYNLCCLSASSKLCSMYSGHFWGVREGSYFYLHIC